MKNTPINIFCLFLIFSLLACGNEASQEEQAKSPNNNSTPKQVVTKLKSGDSSLSLPAAVKRSSPETLQEDMLRLDKSKLSAAQLQQSMAMMKSQEGIKDLFIDTRSVMHYLNFASVGYTALDQEKVIPIAKRLHQRIMQMGEQESQVNVEVLASDYRSNPNGSYLKSKYKMTYARDDFDLFVTFYYYSSPTQSYVITEHALNEEDLEASIASLKDI